MSDPYPPLPTNGSASKSCACGGATSSSPLSRAPRSSKHSSPTTSRSTPGLMPTGSNGGVALVPFEMVVGTPGGLRLPFVGTFPKPTCAPTSGPDGTPGVWFCSLGGWVARLANGARAGFPTSGPICRLTRAPGDRRRVALRLHPPVAPPPHDRRALPSHHSVVRLGTRIADGDVSDFEPSSRHAGGSILAFRAWTRRSVHRLCPRRSRTLAPLLRRTPRTRRRTPRRAGLRADR